MPGENGADTLIIVDVGTSTTVWAVVAGQRDAVFNENNTLIDISSKDSGRTEEVLMGRLSQNITLDALYIFGDSGYNALKDASQNGTAIAIRRRRNGTDLEQADAYVETRSESFPDQEAAVVSLDFRVSGAWAIVSS
jgi:TP901-1 family phage major tail protein